jgi:hypothetical protein
MVALPHAGKGRGPSRELAQVLQVLELFVGCNANRTTQRVRRPGAFRTSNAGGCARTVLAGPL